MSITSRHERFEASRVVRVRRYLWYGLGEILLIFVGITLALAFSNWNEERQLRRLEILVLTDIAANLEANVNHIKNNIDTDTLTIAACERFRDTVSRKEPWRDSFARDLYQCLLWSSPFLSSAAYESLKSRGTELITEPELRSAIVNLYEQTYSYLVDDVDKSLWAFHEAVLLPISNRHLRYVEPDQAVPNDYEALLESNEFINFLHEKSLNQEMSIANQQLALAETEKVIGVIETRLSQQVP